MAEKETIAILVREKERADALAAGCTNPGCRGVVLNSSDELHGFLGRERVDAIVIEHDLGGFLTGLEILQRLCRDLVRPRMAVIGTLNPEDKKAASDLGVDLVLPSTASPEDIAQALRNGLPRVQRASVPLQAARLAAKIDFVGPSPQLLVKLVSYLDVDSASVKELAKDISVDSRTTADVLRLTNSASSGLARKASSIADAVSLLGIRRTVGLILAAGAVSTQKSLLKGLPADFGLWHQRRSVLIASVASSFAEDLERVSPDTAHILGLLQDLGILIMARAFGDHYFALLERVRNIGQLTLPVSERQTFGITHAEVTAALLQKWELPQAYVRMVLAHHDTEELADRPEQEKKFGRAMQIGEAVANCGDSQAVQRKYALNRLLERYGAESAEACRSSLQRSVSKAASLSAMFSLPALDPTTMLLLVDEMRSIVVPAEETAAACA